MVEQIEYRLRILWSQGSKTHAIVINPEAEREIFTEGELPKNTSLEEKFGLPVILSKEVKDFLIAI